LIFAFAYVWSFAFNWCAAALLLPTAAPLGLIAVRVKQARRFRLTEPRAAATADQAILGFVGLHRMASH
jgi:hypothetical protein